MIVQLIFQMTEVALLFEASYSDAKCFFGYKAW